MKRVKHLFKPDDETWTEEANAISNQIHKALAPIVDEAVAMNMSMRDLEIVMLFEVSMLISAAVMGRNMKMHKAEQEKKAALKQKTLCVHDYYSDACPHCTVLNTTVKP